MQYNPIVDLYAVSSRPKKYHKGVATKIAESDRYVTVRYHGTDIITIDKYGRSVTLNVNGYFTYTTKKRMNQVLDDFGIPMRVYQHRYDWYVYIGKKALVRFASGITLDIPDTGKSVLFSDNMEVVFL